VDIERLKNEGHMLTLEKIEYIMESEVEKPVEEMDTEIVDMCALILAKAYNPDYKEVKPKEMYRPWEHETSTSKNKTVISAINFDDLWMMSEEEEAEFSEENLIKIIKKEKRKPCFLRDYGLIHECYLTLSEIYGHKYNNQYEQKAEKHSARIRRKNRIKAKFRRKQEIQDDTIHQFIKRILCMFFEKTTG